MGKYMVVWRGSGKSSDMPVCQRETLKRSHGQVLKACDVNLYSTVLCIICFQNSDKDWCKLFYFRLGFNTILLDSEASMGPKSIT